jgi:glycerol kinase
MFIPSLCGLGAPWWNPNVRGVIAGISPSTTAGDIVQAGLEGIAFRVRDIVDSMSRAMDRPLDQLRVDGGMTANASFMQFQADALGIPVVVAASPLVTSLGVAYLALQGAGACPSLCKLGGVGREVGPRQERMSTEESYQKWHGLVNLLSGYTEREHVR